jgi:hypothetical protein
MKKILVMTLTSLACLSAFADNTTGAAGSGQSSNVTTNSQAGANASTDGNAQSITINQAASVIPTDTTVRQVVSGTEILRNTPSVGGPSLTSSNDTCMGSASGSANGPGFGVSIGKTYTDTNCVMLKNSRELWNMGMKAAAMALMCTDAANKEALELTGYECPQTTKARKGNMAVQAAVFPSQEQYTDPIVRARLGLAPLPEAK